MNVKNVDNPSSGMYRESGRKRMSTSNDRWAIIYVITVGRNLHFVLGNNQFNTLIHATTLSKQLTDNNVGKPSEQNNLFTSRILIR